MLRRLVIALVASFGVMAPLSASAAEGAHPPEEHQFSFEGPFGTYDRAAVQRGFLVYKSVCANCHSMNNLSYRNLGEEGGPFAAYRVMDMKTGEEHITTAPHGHGARFIEANDNPFVRALAAEVMIPILDELGQPSERPGRPADRFHAPFPNEPAARAANGGALPPDLSVIAHARSGGAEYIRSLLLGYTGEDRDGKHVNRYFPGELIGMASPLPQADLVTYSDGTAATPEQMATDVATFLQWASDPHMEKRKSTGLQVMIFLLVLTGLAYLSYKAVWRGIKH
ncbi:MAG: cytochrome c1 [Caulobacterales bacterium]